MGEQPHHRPARLDAPAVKRVVQALDSPTQCNFNEKPLSGVFDYFAGRHGIKIEIDREALREAAIGLDVPMTRELKGVTLDSALRLILRDLNLEHLIRDGGLLITTDIRRDEAIHNGALEPAAYSLPNKAAAMRTILELLKETGSFTLDRTPLSGATDILAAKYGCRIQLDSRDLTDAGIPTDTLLTAVIKDGSLDSALQQVLRPHGLTYIVRDEVILIVADESHKSEDAKAREQRDSLAAAIPKGIKIPAEPLTYTGQVTDKLTGKPITGATVTVRRQIEAPYERRIIEEPRYTTDADGKYIFTIPPEQVATPLMYIELDVSHPDYATRKGFGYALSMIRKNEKLGMRPFFEHVELYPADPITGTVVAADGKPVRGVKVLGFSMPDRKDFEGASFSQAYTDKLGAFRLNVAKGSTAIFWLLPRDYAPSAHVTDQKHGDAGRFVLEPGTALKGRVVDENDKPVADVWVQCRDNRRSGEKAD